MDIIFIASMKSPSVYIKYRDKRASLFKQMTCGKRKRDVRYRARRQENDSIQTYVQNRLLVFDQTISKGTNIGINNI